MKQVVIIGSNGQLGTDLVKSFSDRDLIPLSHSDLDICDFTRVQVILEETRPDVVINSAAFNQVDDCETEVEKAFWVNAYAVRNLAHICAEIGCLLVHVGTNYVFDGEKRTPYGEDDPPNPLNVYGVSKLAGEYFVRNLCAKHLVVRTSGLFGVSRSAGKNGNFVKKVVRSAHKGKPIRVVNDQILAPTYTGDLARRIRELVDLEKYGLYHVVNSGQCSWFEFASAVFRILSLNPDLAPATTAEYGTKAIRPAWSVLAQDKVRQNGLCALRPWPEALEAYLQQESHLEQRF